MKILCFFSVTRSLRKRLNSTESEPTISRAGTPNRGGTPLRNLNLEAIAEGEECFETNRLILLTEILLSQILRQRPEHVADQLMSIPWRRHLRFQPDYQL